MISERTGKNKTFVALFRGINVGGHSVIRMIDLSNLFEAMGFTEVSTYIQSGNVIFSAKEPVVRKLAPQIEKKFESSTGHKTKVFIFTNDILKKAAANNPFKPQLGEKDQICHLMFLSGKPGTANVNKLMTLKGEEYQFHVKGQVMYYSYSRKFVGRRRMIDFEKVLGVTGTSRTWQVVDKLIELSAR